VIVKHGDLQIDCLLSREYTTVALIANPLPLPLVAAELDIGVPIDTATMSGLGFGNLNVRRAVGIGS
jgi:tetrahydromethanopterin S-methyltransferase subunit E